jgi:hypothetical protein
MTPLRGWRQSTTGGWQLVREAGSPSDALELRRKEAAVREPILVQAPDQVFASLLLLLSITLHDPGLEQLGQLLLRILGRKFLIRLQIRCWRHIPDREPILPQALEGRVAIPLTEEQQQVLSDN